MKVKPYRRGSDDAIVGYTFMCPGCGHRHALPVRGAPGNDPHPSWDFNGDLQKPTFSPSVYVNPPSSKYYVKGAVSCHCWVRDGKIEYVGGTTHALAGKTVDLPDLED